MRLAVGRRVGGGKWRQVWRGGWREEGGGVGEGGRGARCVWVCAQSRAGGAAAAHVMRMQIQATDMPKFHVNQYLHLSRIDSGIDSLKAEVSGHKKAFWSLPMHLYAEARPKRRRTCPRPRRSRRTPWG